MASQTRQESMGLLEPLTDENLAASSLGRLVDALGAVATVKSPR